MGEVTPEMVVRLRGTIKEWREAFDSGDAPAGALPLIEGWEAMLSKWEERGKENGTLEDELRVARAALVSLRLKMDHATVERVEELERSLAEARSRIAYLESEDSEWVPVDMHRRVAEERDEARAEAKEWEGVIIAGQKALGDAGVTPGANGDLYPGIAALQDQRDEAREKLAKVVTLAHRMVVLDVVGDPTTSHDVVVTRLRGLLGQIITAAKGE